MSKTWLVTGCSAGGIGAGIARQALEKGFNVAVTARNTDKVQDIVKDYPETALALESLERSILSLGGVEQVRIRIGGEYILKQNPAPAD